MDHIFRDARFMDASDKRLVLKAWVKFLKNGLQFAHFTERLYRHLINHCSFIAHYNRPGFYDTYFNRGVDTAQFLAQFDARGDQRSVEYGGQIWLSGEYDDLNQAMVEEGKAYIPQLIEKAQATQRESDIAKAQALLKKHGIAA